MTTSTTDPVRAQSDGPPPAEGTPTWNAAELIRATLIAATVAVVLLLVAILPAEYGLDPTGIGGRLGLFRPRAPETTLAVPESTTDATPLGQTVTRQDAPYRTEEMSVTLGWREGTEIKAYMKRGQRFVFSWKTNGGAVEMDMHGERINALDGEFTSYWKEDQIASGNGAFEAPFDGTHGWFWQNFSQEPVTVTVTVAGYFDKIGRP